MANEFQITLNVQCVNGSLSVPFVFQGTKNQTNPGAEIHKLTTSTSPASLSFGGISSARYMGFYNADASHDIKVGPDSSGIVSAIYLKPGDAAFICADPAATYKAQAVSGTPILEYWVYEA